MIQSQHCHPLGISNLEWTGAGLKGEYFKLLWHLLQCIFLLLLQLYPDGFTVLRVKQDDLDSDHSKVEGIHPQTHTRRAWRAISSLRAWHKNTRVTTYKTMHLHSTIIRWLCTREHDDVIIIERWCCHVLLLCMTQNSIANSAHTRNKSNKLSTRAVCMQLHNCTIILCSVASSIEE